MVTVINTVPDWKSASSTGDARNAVKSPVLAAAIGQKIDAENGQARGFRSWSGTHIESTFATESVAGSAVTLANTSGVSQRTSIQFGDAGWIALRDQSCNGGNDFALYNGETGNTPFRYTPDDQLFLTHNLDHQLTGQSTDNIGNGVLLTQNIGTQKPAIGSTASLWINQCIYDVGAAADGSASEFSAVYTMVSPMDAGTVLGKHHVIAYDNHAYSQWTDEQTQRSGMLFGLSELVRPMGFNDWTRDENGAGAFGIAVANTPVNAAEIAYYRGKAGARNYPGTAAFCAAGYSGPSSVVDGLSADADYGFIWGFLAGGGGGSPYVPYDAQSKFQYGFGAYDWTDGGLIVGGPLPTANGSYPPSIIMRQQNNQTDNKYCALIIGQAEDGTGGWLQVQDTAKNGNSDLGFYDRSSGEMPLHISAVGVGFNNKPPVAPPTLPALLSSAPTPAEIATYINALAQMADRNGLAKISN